MVAKEYDKTDDVVMSFEDFGDMKPNYSSQ